MEQEAIGTLVTQFIKTNFVFTEKIKISPTQSLIGSGVIDSTGILELIAYLEQHYHLRFEDHELISDNFDSIEKISAFISKKVLQTVQ